MKLRSLTVWLCLSLVASATSLRAQAQPDKSETRSGDETIDIPRSSDPGKQPFIRHFFEDEYFMWTSPFRKSSYSNRTFTKYVIPFTLLTGALVASDLQTSHLLPNTQDQSKWSLRVSQVGAPYTLAGMSAAMYLISRATHNKKARETGFIGAEAIAHSQLLVQGIKYVTLRDRPLIFKQNREGGLGFFRGGDSFPSGHSSSSFALATVFAYEYGRDHKWVPFLAYGLASTVAASRMSAQKHWVSDIFVGSTSGFLIGRWMYRKHHDPRIDGFDPSRAGRSVPQIGITARGISLQWQL